MFLGNYFNNDEFRRAVRSILNVTEALEQKISTSIETSGIDLEKLPPPEKWSEIYEHYTDSKVANVISQVGRQGWLFYDLVNFLPLTDFYRILEQTEVASTDYQSPDSEMISALEIALHEDTGLKGLNSVIAALRNVDPVGAERRVSYLKQMLTAYNTAEMYALIPPMAYAQLESLLANFSHQQILSGYSKAYTLIYDKRRARQFITDIQAPMSTIQSNDDVGFMLHKSFLEHMKVFESVLLQLSKPATTFNYTKTEDIDRKASSLTSQHYVAHGGLGIDTQVHAAKAITTLIAAILLLHKIKILKSNQVVD